MASRQTRGFLSLLHRADHFENHGAGLGLLSEEEYETFADVFLGGPAPPSTRQFVRPWNGDLVRYDEGVGVFAVLRSDGFIKTCYRPDPAFRGEPANLDYCLSGEAKA